MSDLDFLLLYTKMFQRQWWLLQMNHLSIRMSQLLIQHKDSQDQQLIKKTVASIDKKINNARS